MKKRSFKSDVKRDLIALTVIVAVLAFGFSQRGGGDNNSAAEAILIDGSSTVAPLTEAAAESFTLSRVIVDVSGTGGGFKRFCAGETDIQNASRHIKQAEIDACKATGVEWYEFEVAYDGITIITGADNTWISCITTDQLKKLWQPGSTVNEWSDLDPKFPNEPINLYGPGTDSGTFDYFTAEIVGDAGASRTDYTPSEDDNVIIEGVQSDAYALGFVGYSYAHENAETLKIISVDSGSGCVQPTKETVQSGKYNPLSRPLFVYVNANAFARDEVGQFLLTYFETSEILATEVGLIPAPAADITLSIKKLEGAIVGSVAPDSK